MGSAKRMSNDEMNRVAEATAYLETRGIPATAREFRVRQEFYRFKWDMRVREEGGAWIVVAAKGERPRVEEQAGSERDALRLALAAALRLDEQSA
jgi:hypothetical protein